MRDPRLRLLGYWRGADSPDLPDVLLFVDTGWHDGDRANVWSYLRSGFVVRAYLGPSVCRICGVKNGSEEWSDGTYVWPEGLAHYVREHSVRLPQEFVEHVLARLAELEAALVDDEWWRIATATPLAPPHSDSSESGA